MFAQVDWTKPSRWHLDFSSEERSLLERGGLIVSFCAFTALCAQIAFQLPWTPVPYTLQTFAVMATGVYLRRNDALLSGGLYLLVGALGAPVFAGGGSELFTGGALIASGGYLLAFPLASAIVAESLDRSRQAGMPLEIAQWIAWGVAMLPVYLFGTFWLSHAHGVGFSQAFEWGVAPFIIWDAFKILVLGLVTTKFWSYNRA